jgi:hypothetical protein
MRKGEDAFRKRLEQAFDDLNCINRLAWLDFSNYLEEVEGARWRGLQPPPQTKVQNPERAVVTKRL